MTAKTHVQISPSTPVDGGSEVLPERLKGEIRARACAAVSWRRNCDLFAPKTEKYVSCAINGAQKFDKAVFSRFISLKALFLFLTTFLKRNEKNLRP